MKSLGCLTLIILIGVGIYLLSTSQDMTDEQRAQWVGEKAHRGWSKVHQLLEHARQGWQQADQQPPADEGTGR